MTVTRMTTHAPRLIAAAACAALLLAASGCSVLEGDKIDYKSAGRGVSLEVPPDLTQLPGASRYSMPGDAVTASGYEAGVRAAESSADTAAATQIADVQFERSGAERWLHVRRPPDKIWGEVRDFWQENGFLLTLDQPKMGLMETDWAENRAKIPQDFIRRSIGRLFDNLYSTGERDRFRTRIERTEDGGSDIFISHRGMEEVYDGRDQERTVWQPRARDPELEAEFLRRLMVKMGVTQEQAKAALEAKERDAALIAAGAAQVVTLAGGQPAVQFEDAFDRAWRRVGLALDHTGFTVEDRDRSKGLYYVRYVDPATQKKDPGFFARLFGRDNQPLPTRQYQIKVDSSSGKSTVTVLGENGAPAPAEEAQRIVRVLADDLK